MKTTTIRITEDQHTWIRENRPNQLSAIVREHLDVLIHQETPVGFHNAWREQAQKCYPFMRGGYCALCWPAGTPPRQQWMDYIKENGLGSRRSISFEEWSESRHARRQATLAEWNSQERPAPGVQQRKKRLWARFIGKFW